MKIEHKVYNNYKTFDELQYGDVFIFSDGVFMKIETDDIEYNAINLEEGYTLYFFKNDKVQLVTATLTIE